MILYLPTHSFIHLAKNITGRLYIPGTVLVAEDTMVRPLLFLSSAAYSLVLRCPTQWPLATYDS